MTQIGLDICLLREFNLMDYSLLFVIEYNPVYIKQYPHEYLRDSQGNVQYPV